MVVGADLERALRADDVERDRRALDRHDLADQLHQIGDRSAGLAGVDLEQRFFLRVGGGVVDVDRGGPVAFQDVAGDVRDGGDRGAGHIDIVDRALVHVPGDDRVAGAEIGVFADPARTQDTAVADLEQPAFKLIAHCFLHGRS